MVLWGEILKQFKKKWYNDNVINIIDNNMVHVVKQLRIGNSTLRRHSKKGFLKICINCDEKKEEIIEHYLMECKKYMNLRKQMMETVSANVFEMGENISVIESLEQSILFLQG